MREVTTAIERISSDPGHAAVDGDTRQDYADTEIHHLRSCKRPGRESETTVSPFVGGLSALLSLTGGLTLYEYLICNIEVASLQLLT